MYVCFMVFGKLFVYLRSAFVTGGFLVAQLVRIALDPNHCPLIDVMALSASCNLAQTEKKHHGMSITVRI